MSLTSYRAAPPRANCLGVARNKMPRLKIIVERYKMFLTRFGSDLLSHVLRRSTIGAVALNGRVRNGAGCFAHAMTTKPRKEHHPSQALCSDAFGSARTITWLSLDQIKPIEQLVPVN